MPSLGASYDVVIVGAGLSGIGTAYWLQEKCPDKRFVILESRERLGGTWDLFRYPGIRSDSDMFTFGYRFQPWDNPQSLSSGPQILAYLHRTAREHGIDRRIHYRHRLLAGDWDSRSAEWTLRVNAEGEEINVRTSFLYVCAGYYDYERAHQPEFAGQEAFTGHIVHPQFWRPDIDYTDRRVVVVGSGATAVTLVPELAKRAAHVTMLQRSPTHIMTLPNRSGLYVALRKLLPNRWAYRLTRWFNLGTSMLLYQLTQVLPERVAGVIRRKAAAQVGPGIDADVHFRPSYPPWEQRLCLVPDGDLFQALRAGKAEVVTDTIDCFTPAGIRLASGREVAADLVVTATGLRIRLMGGAALRVDGKEVDTSRVVIYKGMLASGIPNFAVAFGYTNASWTLKTDLTANYVCRLLRHMDRKGYTTVVPRPTADVREEPFMNLSAGYILRARDVLPRQGSRRPWRVYQNYAMDALVTRFGKIEDGILQFGPPR